VEVIFCSDAVSCEEVQVDATLTWDQREYVEVVKHAPVKSFTEIKQVPAGEYAVKLRFLQDGQVVSKVLQEFTITED
jgi:hypothetical protein